MQQEREEGNQSRETELSLPGSPLSGSDVDVPAPHRSKGTKCKTLGAVRLAAGFLHFGTAAKVEGAGRRRANPASAAGGGCQRTCRVTSSKLL